MSCESNHCRCCRHNDSALEPATDSQRSYIKELIQEVGRKWPARKFHHAIAESQDPMLRKGDASNWISRLLRIRKMQRYWAS